ncbi:FKBP-type peptidyl-prolyl cis-trans isomerase [Vibrio fluvialis]|nr:FKBP-type peptidyl-prolyl cis-trans isomerase [Vibrio fluvialis]
MLAKYGQQVTTINGSECGWVLGNCLLDKNYKVVAVHQNGVTTAITGEFVGTLVEHHNGRFMLVHTSNEYDNYEPIWVSSTDKATKNIRAHAFVDVTHRAFGIQHVRSRPYTPKSSESVQYPEQQMIAHQLSNYQQTNDKINIGDRVNIDFQGRINGAAFEGGKANNFPLVVGEGRMVHGFEEGLLGKKAGDIFDIEITFPDDYHAESLKGKVAVFSIVVNKTERCAENELV